jgi:hypothetical protein
VSILTGDGRKFLQTWFQYLGSRKGKPGLKIVWDFFWRRHFCWKIFRVLIYALGPNFGTTRLNPAHHGRARICDAFLDPDGVINVSHQVLRAAYEIPLCVSYLFLVVQSLRAMLNDMREQHAHSRQA